MSRIDDNAILIIASSEGTTDISALVAHAVQPMGMAVSSVAEPDVSQQLAEAATTEKLPAVVVIEPKVGSLSALTQALQGSCSQSQIVFLQTSECDIANKLLHVPIGRLHWSVVDLDHADLAKALAEAATTARKRARLQTTLDRANRQLSAFRSSGSQRRTMMSDYYLASFLAHAQDAIVAVDSESVVLYWSAGAERLFGYSKKETVGAPVSDLPFWSPLLQQHLNTIRTGKTDTISAEFSCDVSRGKVAVEIVFSAVQDDLEGLIGASLIIRDITERNKLLEAERVERSQAARMIETERRHLRSLFKQAPGFIAVTAGPRHVFEVANDAYYQIVGHRSILGKPVREALPEMRDQGFVELLDQVFDSGETYVGRGLPVTVQRTPGAALETLYVDFVFQPIIEPDGSVAGIFCQGSDITEHKRTQEELARHRQTLEQLVTERTKALEHSQRALQRSQKLEAIGKLTGGVAHDFNNVLQIIAGNLQLLQLELEDPTLTEKYVTPAVDAVDRGAKLSSQLLAFARRQPLKPVVVNLSRILRSMDDLLRRVLGETIEIETVISGGLWNTLVDSNQLENVVLNLAINARDAMPEGGKLTLELGNAMLDDQYVMAQPDAVAGQYVMLAVSDTGKGMSPEVVERAFDPFFTTKKEGEGTGLGLSMAYGFVKQSGGHIKIYSEPGNGTTFKIYLPRSHEPEVDTPAPWLGPAVGGSETILVVEDDPAVQETAVRVLKDLGYKVLKASDGQSALNVLQSGLHIDMLFTDVVMPGPMRSPELAKQAKVLFPDIAILYTSGYTQNAIVHGGRLDPGVELLSKPYRREDLARKVRHVLANAQQASKSAESSKPSGDPAADNVSPMQILVVEDNEDSKAAICDLLTLLGHEVQGVDSAEEAKEMLDQRSFDLLFTDVNLPGMSGKELVEEAIQRQPDLRVIFASGYGAELGSQVNSIATILPKPFDLDRLKQALIAVKAKREYER
jgi:PAS domain S-box-containing protein